MAQKKKAKDPTSSTIKNSSSQTRTKEQRWLEIWPEPSLEIITNDPDYNIHCRACDSWLSCTCKSDLKTHVQNKSHPKKVKKWKENDNKKRQSGLGNRFTSVGATQQRLLDGFMFSSFICNIAGNGAA